MIAMALLFVPELVIMDEPTSALDVVAQRSLMVQIKELQERLGFAVLFVTHDMSLVSHFSDRLMVMYAGQVAEIGPTRQVFDRPLHPYSQGLLEAFPSIRGERVHLTGIPGNPPDLGRAAERVPVPPALPAGDRALPDHVSRSCTRWGRRGALPAAPAGRTRRGDGMTRRRGASPLLQTVGLTKHFPIGSLLSRKMLHAVDDADLVVQRQQIVALAGESGSGKSTIARLIAKVYEPTRGHILFEGQRLDQLRGRTQTLAYRGDVPMVFQDPFSSLNPAFPVSHAIMRGLKLHRRDVPSSSRRDEAERVLTAVGLSPAADVLDRYPYELSGGQRQRIGFAQALAYRPKLIVADEPVSMLDVSIRIGLLNLMTDLRDNEGVSLLYITHDIASARYVADRLVVMYAGQIAESGPTEQVLARPRHPYTQLLLSAVPDPRAPLGVTAETDRGEPPKVVDPTPGCRFRFRCPLAIETCHTVTPLPRPMGPEHAAACHVATADPGVAASAAASA